LSWTQRLAKKTVFVQPLSTESGIFDYRGPDGVWTRREKGLPPRQMEKSLSRIEPNRGHSALVELQTPGKIRFLISQNHDPTPFDYRAHLRFTEQVGEVMHRTVKQLKGLMGLNE